MIRLTGQRFTFLLKSSKRVPFLSQRVSSNFQIKYYLSAAKLSSSFNENLQSGRYYEVLGYPKGTEANSLTDAEVKRQYLAMVKKYHSDGVIDPEQKVENEEITKCIIQAYDKISSVRMQAQIDRGIYDKIYKD